MRKSDKVLNHQKRLKKYNYMRTHIKNWKQRIHELKDSDLHFGISRRTMRWKAKNIQGGWRE